LNHLSLNNNGIDYFWHREMTAPGVVNCFAFGVEIGIGTGIGIGGGGVVASSVVPVVESMWVSVSVLAAVAIRVWCERISASKASIDNINRRRCVCFRKVFL